MNRKFVSFGGVVIALALLLSVNILASTTMRSMRLDLTENKLYTLSDGAKRVIAAVDEPITLRLYYSKSLAQDYPPLPSYFQRVEELLLEFANRSDGKIALEVIDPEPFSEEEDRAVQFGLSGIPVPGTGETLYFGLAGSNTIGDEEIIPFFQPDKEEFLEYDLAQLVHALSNPAKLVVGVMSPLPIEGAAANPFMQNAPQPWFIMDQIRQFHDTQAVLPTATEIPEDIKVLLVVHPKDLSPATLYAIDQFVLRGGKLIGLMDPFCEADVPPQDPSNPMAAMMASRSSTFGPLLDAWGIEYAADKIVADRKNARSVTVPSERGTPEPVDYVAWIELTEDGFNEDEVVTSELSNVLLATAGWLGHKEDATTEFTPLLTTSEEVMKLEVTKIQFGPQPAQLLADFFPINESLTVAARLSGTCASAYPDGPPDGAAPADDGGEGDDAESAPPEGHLSESEGPITVVLFADADFLDDRWWVQLQNFGGTRLAFKRASNGDLVVNLIDYLQGSTDLISLRSRGGSSYPFTRVEDLQRQAEQAFRAEEQRLIEELQRAEQRLADLQSKREGEGAQLLSAEELAEIDRWREEQITTRKRLREVRRNLKKDIEGLGTRLKWLNIGLVPALVLLFALGMGAWRANRKKAA